MSAPTEQPGLGRRLYQGWMQIVVRFGEVQTLLLLTLVYSFVIGPMALGAMAARKDLLHKRLQRGTETEWNTADSVREPDLERARRLF